MDGDVFKEWVERYRDAWERRDANAAAGLFTDDATYEVTPFDEPLQGREAIRDYWQQATDRQRDVGVLATVLAVGDVEGMAHWRATYTQAEGQRRVELDGVLVAAVDAQGHCTSFREWWHRREVE